MTERALLPAAVFFILLASLLIHVMVLPYRRDIDNNIESIVLLAALVRYMLTLIAGLDSIASTRGVAEVSSLLSFIVIAAIVFTLSRAVFHRIWKRQ